MSHAHSEGPCVRCGAPPGSADQCGYGAAMRRVGDYCPTPGAESDTNVWRDPERSEADRRVRTVALTDLHRTTATLGTDEIRVLCYLAERLRMGAAQYGRLDLATDRRDWRKELGEEAADALVYAACRALTREAGK